MSSSRAVRRRSDWTVPVLLMLLALVPSVAGGGPVTEANARLVAMPWPVIIHVLAAVPFGLVGALQFSAGLRCRASRRHRVSG